MEEEFKLGCHSLVKTELDGTKVFKAKKKFDNLDDAINECKKINVQEHRISKLVSYKCNYCYKYHIGRNGKMIKKIK